MSKRASRRRSGARSPKTPAVNAPGWASGLRARHPKGDSLAAERLTPNTSRPTAALNDPVLRYHAQRIDHVGINAFLVALAAWQRGLQVSFHYELATQCERFADLPVQGYRGEVFSVSDGRKTHYFRRTLGDLCSLKSSALASHKAAAKQHLAAQGLDVPDGIVVSPDQTQGVRGFLARHPGKRLLIKPLGGTLGRGIIRDIPADGVSRHLQASQEESLLLEEMVSGAEYRVYVTDQRYVAAYQRRPVSVEGDGRHSIAQLIDARQRQRRQGHPLNAVAIPTGDNERRYLAEQGLTFDSVPAPGERIYLNDDPSRHHGADQVEATDSLPEAVREACVRCAQALGLPFSGVDVIVQESGRYAILEANQCPILLGAAFPTLPTNAGNRVAESLIDRYFPGSVDNPRHTKASFDFVQVCQTLQNGTLGAVSLPVLGPDWEHQRISIPATQVSANAEQTIKDAMFAHGIHAQRIKTGTGDLMIDIVAPKERYQRFKRTLEGK